jgi:hypothetical protein
MDEMVRKFKSEGVSESVALEKAASVWAEQEISGLLDIRATQSRERIGEDRIKTAVTSDIAKNRRIGLAVQKSGGLAEGLKIRKNMESWGVDAFRRFIGSDTLSREDLSDSQIIRQ